MHDIINFLKKKQKIGQPIREDGPKWQIEAKKGTPTMGGTMILLALISSTLLWADINNKYIWLILFITFSFGLIGFIDDYIKLSRNSYKGLSSLLKVISQIIISLIFTVTLFNVSEEVNT